jgi:hypothetical protein
MKITSSAFEHDGMIDLRHTCDGEDVNPPLTFSDVPTGAKSLALIMEDPDVPTSIRSDGMWDHWVVWNILPTVSSIAAASTPPGVVGKNTGSELGYQGPCPPDREHRYFFKLFALDVMLDLHEGASKQELEQAIQGHIIAQAELIGRYNR